MGVAGIVTTVGMASAKADTGRDSGAGPRASEPGRGIGGVADGADGRRAQHAAGDLDHDRRHHDRHGARLGDGRCASEASASPRRALGVDDGERGAKR